MATHLSALPAAAIAVDGASAAFLWWAALAWQGQAIPAAGHCHAEGIAAAAVAACTPSASACGALPAGLLSTVVDQQQASRSNTQMLPSFKAPPSNKLHWGVGCKLRASGAHSASTRPTPATASAGRPGRRRWGQGARPRCKAGALIRRAIPLLLITTHLVFLACLLCCLQAAKHHISLQQRRRGSAAAAVG